MRYTSCFSAQTGQTCGSRLKAHIVATSRRAHGSAPTPSASSCWHARCTHASPSVSRLVKKKGLPEESPVFGFHFGFWPISLTRGPGKPGGEALFTTDRRFDNSYRRLGCACQLPSTYLANVLSTYLVNCAPAGPRRTALHSTNVWRKWAASSLRTFAALE
jgi:hypothetical protein